MYQRLANAIVEDRLRQAAQRRLVAEAQATTADRRDSRRDRLAGVLATARSTAIDAITVRPRTRRKRLATR